MSVDVSRFWWLGVAFWLSQAASVARAEVYELPDPGTDIVGALGVFESRYEDTFIEIGRMNSLGFEELRIANPGVDPWLPGEATEVVLPTRFILPGVERRGVVVNVAEFRVYYFFSSGGRNLVATVPASVGRMDWATPVGVTRIVAKSEQPSWYPPQSVRDEHAADGRELPPVVPPGPDNPLGEYAIRLALPGYLIHGTNRPAGIGMQVTHGCIRLLPEDIAWLFPRVSLETPVRIINQPVKFGWDGDDLLLEVHPPLQSADEKTAADMTLVTREFVRATGEQGADINWELVAQVYAAHNGIPVKVGERVAEDNAADKLVDRQPERPAF